MQKSGQKMQPYNFRTVEDCLDFLSDEELLIVEHLRSIVLQTIPEIEERLSYNVPFYKRKKTICYIWPGSIYWGSKRSYKGVELGFTQGHLLSDPDSFLEKGRRKQVYFKRFVQLTEIDQKQIERFLLEAVLIDDGQL